MLLEGKHLEDETLQVARLRHAHEDRVVSRLTSDLQEAEPPLRQAGRMAKEGLESIAGEVMGTGAGDQETAWRNEPHGQAVELEVAPLALPDLCLRLDEGWGIEDDGVEPLLACGEEIEDVLLNESTPGIKPVHLGVQARPLGAVPDTSTPTTSRAPNLAA